MNKSLLLIFLATFSIAVPAPPPSQRGVKLARSVSVRARTSMDDELLRIIVAIRPNTVDPHARGAWLNAALSSHDLPERDLSSTDLKLTWDETIFNGFAGTFSYAEFKVFRTLVNVVRYIDGDLTVNMGGMTVQNDAPWGLSRISSWMVPLPLGSDPDKLDFNYGYDERAGEGVDIYILDTGVRTSHSDFEGRAKFLGTTVPGVPDEDKQGHGTHIAGVAAGSKYGVAKKASILAIKCVGDNGKGWQSDVITAIQVAVHSAISSGRPSIINLSIYAERSKSFDEAISNAVNHGVPVVVLAGNKEDDTEDFTSEDFSPGGMGGAEGNPGVITVGATNINDGWYSLTNFGPAIDVLAPGADIWSCGISDDNAVVKKSGTSMAAAYVSGVAALIMSQQVKLSPSDLKSKIISLSVPAHINGLPSGTPNLLVYSGGVVTGGKWDTSAATMCSKKVEPFDSVVAL